MAIPIYFANGDPVPIHSLAVAAFEIFDDLGKDGPDTGCVFKHAGEQISKPRELAIFAPRAAEFF